MAGDDFEDFIQACARAAENYNPAIRAPDTRYEQEYRMHLDNLCRLGDKVQRTVRNLKLGGDFDFPGLTRELEHIYARAVQAGPSVGKAPSGNFPVRNFRRRSAARHYRRRTRSRPAGLSAPGACSDSPTGIFHVLEFDIQALRNMEFTTENGGSVASSVETRRRFNEYRRLFSFFLKHRRSVRMKSANDVSLRKVFDRRCLRLQTLALELSALPGRHPDARPLCHLPNETASLLHNYEELRTLSAKKRAGQAARRGRLGGGRTGDALRAEMSMTIRNIQTLLTQWEQAGFSSDEPLAGRTRNLHANPAAALREDRDLKSDYSRMSQAQLAKLLKQRRQAICRGNTSMTGFDRESARMYLLSLSPEQRQLYNEYLRDFKDQGRGRGLAARSAIQRLHSRLCAEENPLSAEVMARILRTMDRAQERRKTKKPLHFDVRRGNAGPERR